MKKTANTPTVAIARVLRGLGLKQGSDFRVKGQYQGTGANRERIGTYVAVYSAHGDQVVADNADRIEELVQQDGGFAFRVSIHFTAGGRMWTWIANYGQRTRDQAPAVQRPTTGSDAPAEDARRTVKQIEQRPGRKAAPVIRATLGAPRPAFEQPSTDDPYAGKAQKRFGALYWACEMADQVWFFQDGQHGARYTLRVYRGRVQSRGWYLSGPGLPAEGRHMGVTLTAAAEASEAIILEHRWITERMEGAARDWPKGKRVSGTDTSGKARTGTVNGVSWGVVTVPGHENYGRTWVDVDWDALPGDMGAGRRNRPFTDELTAI